MAERYKDSDTGNDGNDSSDWANSTLSQEALSVDMAAGDTGFIQGAAIDTAAAIRTLSSPGTDSNPCKFIGVADGTTNEPPVLSDLASTLPKIETTGVNTLNISGSYQYTAIHFISGNRITLNAGIKQFVNCHLAPDGRFASDSTCNVKLIDTIYEVAAGGSQLSPQNNSVMEFFGGSLLATASDSLVRSASAGILNMTGFDLSALGTNNLYTNGGIDTKTEIRNCKIPSTFNFYGSTPTSRIGSITVIASSDITSVGVTDSIQDYMYSDLHGDIDLDTTQVRTGGADDDASGAFAYAMTTLANATLESSSSTLKSPWMDIWLAGGSNTVTIYIANDGGLDYNEDEVWVEFYTPDASDTAQHDQTFDPADERLFASSTAITDDAVSTWGGTAANGQKLSVTVTTGFEGEAQCRLHLAKRQATPDTLFLDPLPAVT